MRVRRNTENVNNMAPGHVPKMPPAMAKAGMWLAQQGDSGLRVGRRPSGGAVQPSNLTRASGNSSLLPRLHSRHPAAASEPACQTPDSLDDLLTNAKATLQFLEQVHRRTICTGISFEQSPAGRIPDQRQDARNRDFWRPRCNASLWTGNAGPDISMSDLGESDSDSISTCSSADVTHGAWSNPRLTRSTPVARRGSRNIGQGRETRQPNEPACNHGCADNREEHGRPPNGAGVPREGGNPKDDFCGFEPGNSHSCSGNGFASASAQRGQRAGFQFGCQGSGVGAASNGKYRNEPKNSSNASAESGLRGPELEIARSLAEAKSAGPETTKTVLRQLLLKWHPDKAPQGSGSEALAARDEATRVLRFILQERIRLGI